jgi:hypothetical protein
VKNTGQEVHHYAVFSKSSSSLLGTDIFNTPFSETLSLCSSIKVRDKVFHPYRTTGKITLLYILIFSIFDMMWEDKNILD